MNTDTAFTIGSSHEICQDYTFSRAPGPEGTHMIICDGCSSSKMTDVGARLLALSVDQLIDETGIGGIAPATLKMLETKYAHEVKVHPYMFDSTLLIAKYPFDPNKAIIDRLKYVSVEMIGDGVLVTKRKSGIIQAYNIVYPNGYPAYISYNLDKKRKDGYLKLEPDGFVHTYYDIREKKNETTILKKGISFKSIFLVEDYEWITLFSDGVHSFVNTKTGEPISFIEVITELTNFKLFTGRFIQRRLNRFIKDCKILDWKYYDDLSMGTIYLGD